MLRSCVSLFAATGGIAAAAMLVALGARFPVVGWAVCPEVVCPEVAGELAAGLFVCREGGGAFGAKNFAQAIITNIDSNEATKMRSSGLRPFSFCGSLTNVSRP